MASSAVMEEDQGGNGGHDLSVVMKLSSAQVGC